VAQILPHCKAQRLIKFTTTSEGFKPVKGNPSSPVHVGFFGDSYTEGLWVLPELTFASLVTQKLDAQGYNFGINGYSTLEMRWCLEHFSEKYALTHALLFLFPNDVHYDYEEVLFNPATFQEGFSQLFHHILKIREYCEAHTIRYAFIIVPCKQQYQEDVIVSPFFDALQAWGRTHEVTFYDGTKAFPGLEVQPFWAWDPHFSEKGHRLFAEWLLQLPFWQEF
jgi:lysophospholipase L1-like esterase